MRRLNKTEVRALAEKFLKENFDLNTSFTEATTNTKKAFKKKVDEVYNDDFDILKKYGVIQSVRLKDLGIDVNEIVPIGFKYTNLYSSNTKSVNLSHRGVVKTIRISPATMLEIPEIKEIEREIVVAQIETEDLSGIMSRLKDSFNV